MGKKFACGSSVTKAPGGGEEIVVQGDLSDEIEEWLVEKYKDIPEDNIEQVSLFVPYMCKDDYGWEMWGGWIFSIESFKWTCANFCGCYTDRR